MRPTRSGLFTIELLIAVGVFIFCAAICLGLFARAETVSAESADLNMAVNKARAVSEGYKACSGDVSAAAKLYAADESNGCFSVYYDGEWKPVADAASASFTLTLSKSGTGALVSVRSADKCLPMPQRRENKSCLMLTHSLHETTMRLIRRLCR